MDQESGGRSFTGSDFVMEIVVENSSSLEYFNVAVFQEIAGFNEQLEDSLLNIQANSRAKLIEILQGFLD